MLVENKVQSLLDFIKEEKHISNDELLKVTKEMYEALKSSIPRSPNAGRGIKPSDLDPPRIVKDSWSPTKTKAYAALRGFGKWEDHGKKDMTPTKATKEGVKGFEAAFNRHYPKVKVVIEFGGNEWIYLHVYPK